jgi:hypothetical protein
MNAPLRMVEDPMTRARSALKLVAIEIAYVDESTEGEDVVGRGLNAMASALADLKGLNLGAAPLDMVLAEMGESDDLVKIAAELIELIGQASYTGLSREDAGTAEDHRGLLYDALEELMDKHAAEQGDA